MKVAFQTNTICHRGTTVAVKDYARYNQEILGNESVIVYPESFYDPGVSQDSLTQADVLEDLKNNYNVITYSSLADLNNICEKENIDATYFIKAGFNDGLVTKTSKNLIHAVFQSFEPHGDRYAYISDWLARTVSNGKIDYVPHIVDMPESRVHNVRELLNIPKDKIVVGRYGGLHQFDIPFVMQTVFDIVNNDSSFVFVFVNTAKFIDHQNIIFLNPIIDPQLKSDFINSCDAMLHARSGGESFGLAICEFLFHNKPVFAWEEGTDKNHVELLKNTGNLYNIHNIKDQLLKLKDKEVYDFDYKGLVSEFNPISVMEKFNTVFLK